MNPTFKLEGFRELERALAEDLPKATARSVLRRTGINALKPLELVAQQHAPKDTGKLERRITTKYVRAQRGADGRYLRSTGVSIATGPTGYEAGGKAAWQEFGTVKMPAHPYMRPAADSQGLVVVRIVRDTLANEIDKTKARIAARLARQKG